MMGEKKRKGRKAHGGESRAGSRTFRRARKKRSVERSKLVRLARKRKMSRDGPEGMNVPQPRAEGRSSVRVNRSRTNERDPAQRYRRRPSFQMIEGKPSCRGAELFGVQMTIGESRST